MVVLPFSWLFSSWDLFIFFLLFWLQFSFSLYLFYAFSFISFFFIYTPLFANFFIIFKYFFFFLFLLYLFSLFVFIHTYLLMFIIFSLHIFMCPSCTLRRVVHNIFKTTWASISVFLTPPPRASLLSDPLLYSYLLKEILNKPFSTELFQVIMIFLSLLNNSLHPGFSDAPSQCNSTYYNPTDYLHKIIQWT